MSHVTSLSNYQAQFGLVVPTYNPGLQAWAQLVQALQSQNCKPMQVVVVDSGSTDGSLALSQQAGFTVLHTQAQHFNHGATRKWALNQGFLGQHPVNESSNAAIASHPIDLNKAPQFAVFLTQDAILASPNALAELLQAFQDPQVAAAYGRQLPKPQAHWLEAHTRAFNYPETSRTVQLQDKDSLGLKVCFFSNAFGAYRLSALQALGGLPAGLPLGEDTFTAGKLLLSGQSLHYQANAAVYHSHHYNGLQDFQRMFDTGVFHAQNPWLVQSFGRAEGEGWRLLRHQWAHLQWLASGQAAATATATATQGKPPSLLGGLWQMVFTNAVKLCGYKMGQWHRLWPKSLNKRLSMYKSFWQPKA